MKMKYITVTLAISIHAIIKHSMAFKRGIFQGWKVKIQMSFEDFLEEMVSGRYSLLGYRNDLVDVIAMTDLFVNPPRQGGGGGAGRAFAVGVPVVTYPDCDVSNVTGEDFCCNDLQEMKKLIQQYASDEDFYHLQQEKVRERCKERENASDSVKDEVRKMLEQVTFWLEHGEIL